VHSPDFIKINYDNFPFIFGVMNNIETYLKVEIIFRKLVKAIDDNTGKDRGK
jgi:hypothetical protein